MAGIDASGGSSRSSAAERPAAHLSSEAGGTDPLGRDLPEAGVPQAGLSDADLPGAALPEAHGTAADRINAKHSEPEANAAEGTATDNFRTAQFGTDGSSGGAGLGADAGGEVPADTGWKHGLASSLAFLRRRLTGDYTVDEFGYDPDFADSVLLPPLKLLYEKWFRIETLGMANIPDTGGALLVANHSGTIAIDAVMTAVAVREHHPMRRPLRMLGADLVFDTPFLGPISRKAGNTLACNPDAERLLSCGELVAVYPEGFKGVGKPYAQRYKLQRFGRGGFVTAALRTGMPIIPVSIVGAEEIYPLLGNLRPLARALGLPYFPVTPTFPLLGPLGAIPLPSKWIIEFGEPIPTDIYPDNAADDPMVVFNLTDQVRETIQQTLYRLLLRRGHPFLG